MHSSNNLFFKKQITTKSQLPTLNELIDFVLSNMTLPQESYNYRIYPEEDRFVSEVDKTIFKDDYYLLFNLSAKYGFPQLACLLIHENKITPSYGQLKLAVHNGLFELVALLLTRVDPTIDDNSLLMDSANAGATSIFKLLLQDQRIKSIRESVLKEAAFYGHNDIVVECLKDQRLMLAAENSHQILRAAVFGGHEKTVSVLLNNSRISPVGSNNTIMTNNALFDAVDGGHDNIALLLLNDDQIQSTFNQLDYLRFYQTIVFIASKEGNPQLLEGLLNKLPKEVLSENVLTSCYKEAKKNNKNELTNILIEKNREINTIKDLSEDAVRFRC